MYLSPHLARLPEQRARPLVILCTSISVDARRGKCRLARSRNASSCTEGRSAPRRLSFPPHSPPAVNTAMARACLGGRVSPTRPIMGAVRGLFHRRGAPSGRRHNCPPDPDGRDRSRSPGGRRRHVHRPPACRFLWPRPALVHGGTVSRRAARHSRLSAAAHAGRAVARGTGGARRSLPRGLR
jgi:hypothetical protein